MEDYCKGCQTVKFIPRPEMDKPLRNGNSTAKLKLSSLQVTKSSKNMQLIIEPWLQEHTT
jgi:hypothetical protein